MVGRPRIQWEEMVKFDAKNLLGIRNWRTKASHRDDWKALIREAMVQKRAKDHWMDGFHFFNPGRRGKESLIALTLLY